MFERVSAVGPDGQLVWLWQKADRPIAWWKYVVAGALVIAAFVPWERWTWILGPWFSDASRFW
jgi:hypothetical protein